MYEARSSVWLLVLAALIALALVGLFVVVPVADDATQRAQYSLQATQAEESGKTERATQEQQTQRRALELRAEQDARASTQAMTVFIMVAPFVGTLALCGLILGGMVVLDGVALRRTLLLREVQQQPEQLQGPTQLYLPREFADAKDREIIVIKDEKT